MKIIRQTVTFRAEPLEVYEALMDSRKHSKFTGSKANISRGVGGRFTAYDGYIVGTNLQLVPSEKIVQSWFAHEDCWPGDHFSRVTFSLKKVKGGTLLAFTQSSVPDDCYEMIRQGWIEHYWTPMKRTLEKGR